MGDLHWRDLLEFFGGQLVYFHEKGSQNNYSEIILRMSEVGT